ncbi:Hypothetical protein SRAE_2000281000 [Strongyloides ratti]|uniref:Epidermal growth factor-like domain-containing protein n=1 Tax=Strongyloides ratti TaxID=34506 RepID=A0A090LEI2_STRRB|nr:Hypothetical protein SRAE_2000281000 [Strongyloides ratti]CEF68152.1 Hypothetical protein SRAE_2000281000 [Strongyloides ratti]
MIIPLAYTDIDDVEPIGLNVCIFEKEVLVRKPEKIVVDGVVRYPMKEVLVKKNISHCCDGFYQNSNNTCSICDYGKYGKNCSLDCGECQNNMICNNVVGCALDPLLVQKSLFKKYFGYGLLALIGAVSLLVFLVMYYRKKYRKEKDPALPTVVYHDTKSQDGGEEGTNVEINNPIYSFQDLIDGSDKSLKKTFPDNDDGQNKYEVPGESSNIYTSIQESKDDSSKTLTPERSGNLYSDWVIYN